MNKKTKIFGNRCSNFDRVLGRKIVERTTQPCSENCNCYLTKELNELKKKIAEQSKILNEIGTSNEEIRCNVKLTQSEEKLFGLGNVKDDSMVCCILVRELRAQKRDLESMMASWIEFTDKTDHFTQSITEIRAKLTELTPRIESILHDTKVLEVIELEYEETRKREIDEELQRSSTRRKIFREMLDRFIEAEARHHLENEARHEKFDMLEYDRSMDRGALKLALAKMMKVMSPSTVSDSENKTEIEANVSIPEKSLTGQFPPININLPRDIRISYPNQSCIRNEEKTIDSYEKIDNTCPAQACRRKIVRHPF